MTPIDICLGIIVVFSSTCFGYSVGKNAGFKEGMEFYANIMSKLTLRIEEEGDKKR